MNLQENYSLKDDNTFRVDVKAKYFAEVNSFEDLRSVLSDARFMNERKLILGHGANLLFTKDFDGLVIKLKLKGIKVIEESRDFVVIEAAAGENWHEFVMYTVEKGLGGVENMVYIPGTVGAAAVQNIAAYGQNLSDVFEKLAALNMTTCEEKVFTKEECEFEYRDSRFKTRENGKYAVTSIQLKLSKNPVLDTSYFETGRNVSLKETLKSIENPTVKDVAIAVMNIRKNKLPDPEKVGTAGSFFKNPVVTQEKYQELKRQDSDLQCYPVDGLRYVPSSDLAKESKVKIPAGRLLDNLGWKGKRIGNVGTHPTQALAVVNYGATPSEILNFTNLMQKAVFDNYGVMLTPEVQII